MEGKINNVPPATNRGVQNTCQKWLRPCVDWVQVTLKTVKKNDKLAPVTLDDVFDLFLLDREDFEEIQYGGYGYPFRLQHRNIRIYYGATDEMGIHIEMTGQGCRQYEGRKRKKEWGELFGLVLKNGGKFTRLDLAIDDFKVYFPLRRLLKKLEKGEAVSKFKEWEPRGKRTFSGDWKDGLSLYFGSEKSAVQICMYEKDHERRAKGQEMDIPEYAKGWNRIEVRLRDKRAQVAAWMVSQEENIGELISGILGQYLRFVDRGDDSNKARWPVSTFWEKFLGSVKPVRLANVPVPRSLEKSINYISRLDRLLAAIVEGEGMEVIEKMIATGRRRFRPEDIEMIEQYKKGKKPHEVARLHKV